MYGVVNFAIWLEVDSATDNGCFIALQYDDERCKFYYKHYAL